jgi:2-alkyl-3-oxoalkanoate reductase
MRRMGGWGGKGLALRYCSEMQLVVTGAAGFIGRAVVAAALARGHRVVAVTRRPGAAPAGATAVTVDLAAPGAFAPHLAGADAVIHCAASLGGDDAAQRRDTIAATVQVADAMRAAGLTRLVLLGSFAVYDIAALAPGAVLDEQSPVCTDGAARGPYIDAKLAQEGIVRDPVRGLDWRILRPGLVFGPGRTWFYHLGLHLHPRLWVSLAGAAELPLTYVENCAEAVVAAAEAPVGGMVVNVVDDERRTRSEYLRALAAHATPSPLVVDLPWAVLRTGARAANLVGVHAGMLHPARLSARCQPQRYTNAEARARLAWRPRIAMADAIARSVSTP